MHVKINNNTSHDLQQLEQLAKEFFPFAQERMGFDRSPVVNFSSDEENSVNPLGKTGYYSPSTMEITIFVDNRHVKDILRSLSHELVHHSQNCRGEFNKEYSTGVGYAQDNDFLRGMEDEAYREGNFCLRDWEDGIKRSKIKNKQLNETIYKRTFSRGEKNMSTKDWKNEELNKNLMERWGYKAPKELNEEKELSPYFDSSNGGDYKTSEKKLPAEEDEEEKKTDDDEEEAAEETTNPLSVENRTTNNKPVEESKKKDLNERITYSEKLLREKLDNKDPFLLYKNWTTEPSDSLHKTTKSKKSLLRENVKKKLMDVIDWLSGGRVKDWAKTTGEGISDTLKFIVKGEIPPQISDAIGDSFRTTIAKTFNTNELLDEFLQKVKPPEVKPGAPPPPPVEGAFKEGDNAIDFLNANGGLFDSYVDALKNTEGLDKSFKKALSNNKAVRKNIAETLISESKSLSSLRNITASILEKNVDVILRLAGTGNVVWVKVKGVLDDAVEAAVKKGLDEGKEAADILVEAKNAIKKAVDEGDGMLKRIKEGLTDPGDLDDFVEGWLVRSEKAAKSIESVKTAARPAAEVAGEAAGEVVDEAAEAAKKWSKLTKDQQRAVKEAVNDFAKAHRRLSEPDEIAREMAKAFRETGKDGIFGALTGNAKKKITDAIEGVLRESPEYKAFLKNPGGEAGEIMAEAFLKRTSKKIFKHELGAMNVLKRFCLAGKPGAGLSRGGASGFKLAWESLRKSDRSYWTRAASMLSAGGGGQGLGGFLRMLRSGVYVTGAVTTAGLVCAALVGVGAYAGASVIPEPDEVQLQKEIEAKKGEVAKLEENLEVLKKKCETGDCTDNELKEIVVLEQEIAKKKGEIETLESSVPKTGDTKTGDTKTGDTQTGDTQTGGAILPRVGGDRRGQKKGGASGKSPSGMPFPGPHDWDGLGSMAVVRKLKDLGYDYDKTQTAGGWWKKLPRMHPARVAYRNFWKSLKKRHPRLGRKRGKKRKLRVVGYDTKRAMDVYAGGVDSSGRPQGTHKQYYEGTPTTGKRPSAKYWPKNRPWPPPNQAVAKQAYEQGLDIRGTEEGDKFLKDVD